MEELHQTADGGRHLIGMFPLHSFAWWKLAPQGERFSIVLCQTYFSICRKTKEALNICSPNFWSGTRPETTIMFHHILWLLFCQKKRNTKQLCSCGNETGYFKKPRWHNNASWLQSFFLLTLVSWIMKHYISIQEVYKMNTNYISISTVMVLHMCSSCCHLYSVPTRILSLYSWGTEGEKLAWSHLVNLWQRQDINWALADS